MNDFAPINPLSSSSVNKKITVFRNGESELNARAVSNKTATPVPSSVAPKLLVTLSK
jgi:hypothetical protein